MAPKISVYFWRRSRWEGYSYIPCFTNLFKQKEMEKEHEWHNIADVNVQRVCDNSIVALTLYVKIINGERFYKVNGEHVRLLPYTEYVNGFGYNAVTSSYRLYL